VIRHGSHLGAALAGFGLMLLADGVWRRKRAAWLLAVVLLLVSSATHLVKGLDYEEAFLSLLLMIILLLSRAEFHARSDPPSVRRGLGVLLAAIGFTLAYGTAGFYLMDHHFRINYALGPAIRQTFVMFTQFYDPGLEPITGFSRYFASSIYLVGLFTTGYALLMILRPVLIAFRRPRGARRAAEIVRPWPFALAR
jgi:phosphatidylglycerol lysyltransferase